MNEYDLDRNNPNSVPVGVNSSGLTNNARAMFDSIAKRAYELFETQGKHDGRSIENWLQAESELFEKPQVRVSESQDSVTVFAEIPGFAPRELEVDLEPRRVTIIGKHDSTTRLGPDQRSALYTQTSRQLFQAVDLPCEIDLNRATANLRSGVLHLDLKRAPAEPAKKARAASASRAS